MNFYKVVGQCSAFCSGKLKEIGFKNISKIERGEDVFKIHLKDISDIIEIRFVSQYEENTEKINKKQFEKLR
jgi:hypothetical protein